MITNYLIAYECEYDVGGAFTSGCAGVYSVDAKDIFDAHAIVQKELESKCGYPLDYLLTFERFIIPHLK